MTDSTTSPPAPSVGPVSADDDAALPEAAAFTRELIDFIESDVATYDEPVDPDTDLLLTGLVDSLGVVMVSTWMQDALGITIDPGDIVLEHFQTVGQMVTYAQARGAVLAT